MLAGDEAVKSTLISGDVELCKAFLFETAVSFAKEGQQVYYFAAKQIEALPPTFHDSTEPTANALKLMTFIYTPTYEDFVAQLTKLHTFQRPPSVLLVDDLDVFADYPRIQPFPRPVHVARCCAVILNTAVLCSKISSRPVKICAISFNADHHAVYRRYFDQRWHISAEATEGNTDEGRRVWVREERNRRVMEYCRLDDAVLVLRRVYERKGEHDEEERS